MLASITGYQVLLSIHVMAAVVWVGGNINAQIIATRIARENDRAKLADMAAQFEFVGTRVFMPASLVLLVLGVWMVLISGAWSFSQFWVLAALAMFAYSFASGAFYLGPSLGKVKALYAAEGVGSQAAEELMRKLFRFSRIELVLLILIVFDMVLKPGL